MANASIEMQTAFPVCSVKVHRGLEDEADWYGVTRTAENTVYLEAARATLRHAPPKMNEHLYIQSAPGDAAYRLSIRVAAVSADDWVKVRAERAGEIERVQRRRRRRVLAKIPVCITRNTPHGKECLSLATEDMNSIGMRILTRTEMPLAGALRIAIDLGDTLPHLVCDGDVVRCHRLNRDFFAVGIRFHALDKANEERIVQVLMQRLFQP